MSFTKHPIWHKPRLNMDEELAKHRKVTWLELFFDLYFVVTISQLSLILIGEINWMHVFQFAFLFLPVWWIWIGGTYYVERFETEGLDLRIFFLSLMIPVAGLAVFAHDGMGATANHFALSYALARFIITNLWLRASIHVHVFRPTGYKYVAGFSISVLFFFCSVFVPAPFKFYMWAVALTSDMLTPWLTLKNQAKLPGFHSSRLPERYGLFMLIVLGESIVGVIRGFALRKNFDSYHAFLALLSIVLCFTLWWIYFDFIARRTPRRNQYTRITWSYLHLILAMCVAAAGAGITNLLSLTSHVPNNSLRVFLMHTLSLFLIITGCIEFTLKPTPAEPTHFIISPLMKIVLGLTGVISGLVFLNLTSTGIFLILIGLMAVQIFYGTYVWFNRELSNTADPG